MFNRLAKQVDKSSEPQLPHPGPLPDSERVQQPQPPTPATVYTPYAEKPALSEPPYKPYGEESVPDEPPYEPYKGI